MEPRTVEIGGHPTRVLEEGKGEPVVVLHGWGGRIESMRPVIGCLAGSFRVVAMNLPGFGESPAPRGAWGTPDYATYVTDVLSSLGVERAHFVGHSYGAKTSIYLAATRPALVDKLILQGSSGLRTPPSMRARVKRGASRLGKAAGKLGPPGRALRQAIYDRVSSADYRDAGALRPTFVKVVNEDLKPLLPRIKASTLLVWGTNDDAVPLSHVRTMERLIPDAGLVLFEGAGHFAYLDEAERFCVVAKHFLGSGMMGFDDPFTGYSLLLRTLVYVVVPAFLVLQYFRARRALHIFQLEGYKRARFLDWCRDNRERARFMKSASANKPLVMTGRAWRLLVTTVVLCFLAVYLLSGVADLTGGFPFDVLTCAAAIALLFFGLPRTLVVADIVMTPLQKAINARFLRAARSKLEQVNPLVVGVTGSFGKTSTKFAIQRLLGEEGEVLATPGSFNTPLGVCRTINEQLTPGHKALVVEMGAYGEGEIAELVAFTRPTIGVLTAIGPAHLERFGSMEAIERGKYEIVRDLPADGTAVMNVDDERVRRLADATEHVKVVRYGIDPSGSPDVTVASVQTTRSGTEMEIRLEDASVAATTKLLGRHAIGHVLAAVAVARVAGVPPEALPGRIARLEPVEHRLQIIQGAGGVTVIDDAYNSNPAGAAAALEVLGQMEARKRVVVTPGIVELGPLQAEENERFGAAAAKVADVVIVVARLNREALERGACSAGNAEVVTVDTLDEATAALSSVLGPGDVVLFENDLPDQYEG